MIALIIGLSLFILVTMASLMFVNIFIRLRILEQAALDGGYPPKPLKCFYDGTIPDEPIFQIVSLPKEKLKEFRNDYLMLLQFAEDVLDRRPITSLDLIEWYAKRAAGKEGKA